MLSNQFKYRERRNLGPKQLAKLGAVLFLLSFVLVKAIAWQATVQLNSQRGPCDMKFCYPYESR